MRALLNPVACLLADVADVALWRHTPGLLATLTRESRLVRARLRLGLRNAVGVRTHPNQLASAGRPRLLAPLGTLVVAQQRVKAAVAAEPSASRAHLHGELTDAAKGVERRRPLRPGAHCRRVRKRLLV